MFIQKTKVNQTEKCFHCQMIQSVDTRDSATE